MKQRYPSRRPTYRRSLFPRFPRLLPRVPRLLPRATFSRRRERGPLGAVAILALCGIGGLGLISTVSGDRGQSPGTPSVQLTFAGPRSTAGEVTVAFSMCGSERYTCVVDGDTIWLEGQNLRLQSFDTPEPYNDICGGSQEVALAGRASARLLELLNGNAFTVETFGLDGTGKRTLATVRVGGRDVGDILIEERLARRWPDGVEWWCS